MQAGESASATICENRQLGHGHDVPVLIFDGGLSKPDGGSAMKLAQHWHTGPVCQPWQRLTRRWRRPL
jgi:hypothetical protein